MHIIQRDNEANLYLKDLSFIILESPQITLTSALLSALAEHKITLLTCDESHLPNGIFMPFLGHFQASQIAKAQLVIKPQTKAILWQKIIKNKITNQAFVLSQMGHKKQHKELLDFAKQVCLNDSTLMESRAAALYFKTLFGISFSRNQPLFINSALNYGYAIVRAAIVRAVCISGLLSWLRIKHSNTFNQFNLCDDIIEVFRAFVDMKALGLKSDNEILDKAHKRELIEILQYEISLNGAKMPLIRGVNHFVQSVKNALLEGGKLANVGFVK